MDGNRFKADYEFMQALIEAANEYRRGADKLDSFGSVVAALAKYSTATNAPIDVRSMLAEMLAELKNLAEGRPTVFIGPGTSGATRPAQREILWAYASVYIDTFDERDRGGACVEVEEKLSAAGLPLPTRGRGDKKTAKGASIQNWRRLRRSTRKTRDIERYMKEAENLFDEMLAAGDTKEDARRIFLESIVELGVS